MRELYAGQLRLRVLPTFGAVPLGRIRPTEMDLPERSDCVRPRKRYRAVGPPDYARYRVASRFANAPTALLPRVPERCRRVGRSRNAKTLSSDEGEEPG